MPSPLQEPTESTLLPTENAKYYEYSHAANPIGAKLITQVPYQSFLPSLYSDGPSRVVHLDLSAELSTQGPATGPGLLASFVRVLAEETMTLRANATSTVIYVISGNGKVKQGDTAVKFEAGSFIALPGGEPIVLRASKLVTLYTVNDEPLLRYMGVRFDSPKFSATYYPPERALAELRAVAAQPEAKRRSRISILLANTHFPQTRTVTHTLWAMYGLLPEHSEQKPHRHQSIALDFIVYAPRGCYSLVGTELDSDGKIRHPQRVDWVSGMAFVTPPGHWHAHYNESSEEAFLIPVQDAGLQTYLRTLDIRFQL